MILLNPHAHNFNPEYFGTIGELRNCRAGEHPSRLMIACCDQGNAPDNTSLGGAGQFYVVQNLAASIPAPDESRGGTILGSIEYAVVKLNVRHVIVCGHSQCGVIRRWMQSHDRSWPVPQTCSARRTLQFVTTSYSGVSHRKRVRIAIREHILNQLEILQSYGFVRSRLQEGRLHLHGWLVDDVTARVRTFDPCVGQFVACETART